MNYDDARDLQWRLNDFSLGNEEHMKITRLEADFLAKCISNSIQK